MCAQKISWGEPDSTLVTKVEINRATTIYGTYSILNEIDATSDAAAKSVSNTWVTTYTDTSGGRDNWYKIRFYDGTALIWSEFSEPVAALQLVTLCSIDDVKNLIDTVGRFSDDEIFDMINEVDDFLYIEMGKPVSAIWSEIGKIDSTVQSRYYVGEEEIYRVDRVFYGTISKTELFQDDAYKSNTKYGMVEILPVASSGVTVAVSNEIEIHYIPKIYHKISLYRTCKQLLEKVDTTSGGDISKELQVMNKRCEMVETILAHRVGLQVSSQRDYYNGEYGVNRKRVVQNFDRNRYIGSTGW